MKRIIKKWDIIIIGVLLMISFLPYIFIELFLNHNVENTYAYITVAGELYKEVPLTGQVSRKEIEIESEYGKNTIVIENERIAIIHADCPDHLCEEFGFKEHIGDIIVCLPHQLYMEIRGNGALVNQTDGSVY